MSRRLALLAACVLALAPFSTTLAQTPPAPAAPAASVEISAADRAAFRKGLAEVGASETFDVVRERFPADYMAFETDLLQAALSGKAGPSELQTRTFNFMKSIRERVLPYAKRAPAPALIAFGEEQLTLMKAMRSSYPRMCYEYVEYGGPSMDTAVNLPKELLPMLNAHNTLQFDIALQGEKAPADRARPSNDDFLAAVTEFTNRKGDTAWLKAVSAGERRSQSDSQRCEAAIIWVESILSLPAEQAARLLAT